jgi:hypothetical protein
MNIDLSYYNLYLSGYTVDVDATTSTSTILLKLVCSTVEYKKIDELYTNECH